MDNSNRRLIVISNRLPAKLRATSHGWRSEKSTGGLATAMNPILRDRGGLWIGWPGESAESDDPKQQEILRKWREDGLVPVDLAADTAEHFYEGYCNQTLWPLFHHFPSRVAFDPQGWTAYRSTNEIFRDAAVREYREGDLLWVHDYHLMLLPRLLREALPGAAIGFFLHIPFPTSEVFRVLPERAEVLEGILGADLVTFQTYSHLQHFRNTLRRVLGEESRLDELEIGGRTVRLDAIPIGIAPDEFTGMIGRPEVQRRMQEFRGRYRDQKLLLAVDRMDYTKGIPERLRAYRQFLDRKPDLRGKVVLLQVAVPSRERVPGYEALRRQVNEMVGEINGQYATPNWTPVVYIRRGISRAELVALYAVADVAWVSPLRDGMNLVAKEYTASKTDQDGVLILSEFAGAAEEMGEALIVNPYDENRAAALIETALSMDTEERRRRMAALQEGVRRNNVFVWSDQFLKELTEAAAHRGDTPVDRPAPLDTDALLDAYRSGKKRLLFLDYDGTLVGYFPRPEDAAPSPELLEVLASLVSSKENSVVIISGRKRADLDQWFGSLDGLWMAAEHGALLRRSGSTEWEPLQIDYSRQWLDRVRPILQHFVERTRGSFLEEKEFSLVWHYRMSESRYSEWLARELVSMLDDMLAETELRALRGRKIVEIRPGWMHKGAVVNRVHELCGRADFEFAAGDDRTDEDLFQAMSTDAWTVHVGPGRSRARYTLASPAEVVALLKQIAAMPYPATPRDQRGRGTA